MQRERTICNSYSWSTGGTLKSSIWDDWYVYLYFKSINDASHFIGLYRNNWNLSDPAFHKLQQCLLNHSVHSRPSRASTFWSGQHAQARLGPTWSLLSPLTLLCRSVKQGQFQVRSRSHGTPGQLKQTIFQKRGRPLLSVGWLLKLLISRLWTLPKMIPRRCALCPD